MPAIYFLCSLLNLMKNHRVWYLLAHSHSLLLICEQQEQALSGAKHFLLLQPPCWVEQEEMAHKPHRQWLRKRSMQILLQLGRVKMYCCPPSSQPTGVCMHTHPLSLLFSASLGCCLHRIRMNSTRQTYEWGVQLVTDTDVARHNTELSNHLHYHTCFHSCWGLRNS